MNPKKRGLGRSLDALLSSASAAASVESGEDQREIPVDRLQPGRHQPRRHFDEEALADLARSIAAQGVVQPIVVRPVGGERYEIVAGERRWRAARQAGLASIPAVIRTLDERGAMAVALVENIQRADLNPLEEADALRRLIDECRLTHEAVAEAVGKSRAAVTNLLRLKELEDEIQALLRDGAITFGHAKVLLGVTGPRRLNIAHRVVAEALSVRQTEALLAADAEVRPHPKKAPRPARGSGELESRLAGRLGLPVRVQVNDAGRGRLTIQFKSAEELDALVRRFD
ncbi:MAG TPA: ParB/RepB/Spo0J family partition protein [Nevskiaceae bacterium]|nr:ParB/RepB/Spo0J family partition protein [Nevskiaceae bacterium]